MSKGMCTDETSPVEAIRHAIADLSDGIIYYAKKHFGIETEADAFALKHMRQSRIFGTFSGSAECERSDGSHWTVELPVISESVLRSIEHLKERTPDDRKEGLDLLAGACFNCFLAQMALTQRRYYLALHHMGLATSAMHSALDSIGRMSEILSENAPKAPASGEWFSVIGSRGAVVRHAPMRELKKWAIAQYASGVYQNAYAASHEIRDSVIEHGRTINANLSPYNAQRTIYLWLLDSDRGNTA